MRRLRAIEKIQVEAAPFPGSYIAALFQTETMVSCINSSATPGLPVRALYAFTRGAKCRNRVSNSSTSRVRPTSARSSDMLGSGGVPACITPAIVLRLAGARDMRTAGFNPLCHAPVTEEISKLMRIVTGDFRGWITVFSELWGFDASDFAGRPYLKG